MRKLSVAIAAACVFASGAASAGVGVWSGQGPYGGYIFDIQQDPFTPAVLYTATRSGIFKSSDAGTTWSAAMNGIVGSVSYGFPIRVDADAGGTLYTADSTGHLYRSTDGAANWLQTGYVLAPVAGLPQINEIVDAPGSTTRLYLVTQANGILVSNDAGATFTPANGSGGTALPAGIPFSWLSVDPHNPNNVIAGTASYDGGPGPNVPTIYRSTDAGAHWTGVATLAAPNYLYNPGDPSCSGPTPPPEVCTITTETLYGTVTDIGFGNGNEVYAWVQDPLYGTAAAIYRSGDNGATWTAMSTSTPNVQSYITTLAPDASTANGLYAGGYFGLKYSTDGGITFADVATAANGFTPNGVDVATASRLLGTGATRYLASQEAGLFVSTNSGASWSGANAGIDATNIRALGMVPDTVATHPRILAGYGDAFRPSPGIYAGFDVGDGNMSWANSNTNLHAYQIRAITVDQSTASGTPASTVVYAGGRSEQLPSIAPRNGGVYKSTDGGSGWTTIDSGLPLRNPPPATPFIGTVRSIVLDPTSCTGYPTCTSALQTVYAAANGCYEYLSIASGSPSPSLVGYCGSPFNTTYNGAWQFRIFKSTNAGASWTSSDNGLPGSIFGTAANNYYDAESLLVVPLVIDPSNPNVLYAGTADTYDSAHWTPTLQTGVYKSTNGGASWSPVNTGLPTFPSSSTVVDILSLAIHPTAPGTLWASTIDINAAVLAPGHIYKTTDGGAHWIDSSVGLTSADIRALLVDPVTPNVLYAAGGGTSGNPGGVFKSYDGGATWHSISIGLPADAGLALALDPANHDKLYAGTSSGVWEMTQATDSDFDGVSDAQEDLGPNNGDSNLDGTKDKFQADVTYVPPHQSALAPVAKGKAPQAPTNNDFAVQVAPQPGSTCVQVQDVQSKSAAANGPDVIVNNTVTALDYDYALDLLQFEILNCASTTVKVTYPNFTFGPGWSFRFFGPKTPGDDASIKWYDFSGSAVKLDAHTWQLTLTRGAFGSYRPAVTGAILFQGGPAYSDRIFAGAFD